MASNLFFKYPTATKLTIKQTHKLTSLILISFAISQIFSIVLRCFSQSRVEPKGLPQQ